MCWKYSKAFYQHLWITWSVGFCPYPQGKIEDLGRMDLGTYAVAATEDCSKRFGDFVSMDVLSAIQRAAAKNWVSKEPYDKDACLVDFDVLLVEPRKLEKNLVESIKWWTGVVNVANPR